MIRISKPAKAPDILSKTGKAKRRSLCAAYTRFARDYDAGTRKFDFDAGVYGHAAVKAALIKAQHGKCAFCESKITHIAYGDVEHFRPKAGCRQTTAETLARPGYYWLAYEWANLFLACQICNRRFKGNLFPLRDAAARARFHRDKLDREEPLFIDPAADDPEAYVSFRKEIPYAINDNPRGTATITSLGLGREELNEVRRDHYQKMRALYTLVNLHERLPTDPEMQKLLANAQKLLNEAIKDSAAYAAMIRAAIASGFPELP